MDSNLEPVEPPAEITCEGGLKLDFGLRPTAQEEDSNEIRSSR